MTTELTVSAVCDASEDLGACAYGHSGRVAWVVDASDPEVYTPVQAEQTALFVSALNRAMATSAEHETWCEGFLDDPAVAVQSALDLALSWWRAEVGETDLVPQASLAVVNVGSSEVTGFVIGECALILRTPESDTAAVDPEHVGGFVADALDAVRHGIEQGTDPSILYGEILPLRREVHAGRMGTPPSVLTDHPAACAYGQAVSQRIGDGENAVLLTTSGLSRLDTELSPGSPARLMDAACGIGVRDTLALVRSIESRDPDCREFARFGRHRAAAGVLVRSYPSVG